MIPRSCIVWLIAALLLPAVFTPAFADAPLRKVTVVGTATIKVVPDEMNWTVSISIHDATVAKAKARHDQSLSDALKFIKSLGSATKDLQTGGIRIDKETYFPENVDKTKPFVCATQFTFTLTNFDQYGALAEGLAKLDGVQVQSVDYASSKQDDTAKDALAQALVNAQEKAKILATKAGCYIDKPLEIIEGATDNSPRPMMMMAKAMGGGTPAAVPGQIEISASVTATYDLYYK